MFWIKCLIPLHRFSQHLTHDNRGCCLLSHEEKCVFVFSAKQTKHGESDVVNNNRTLALSPHFNPCISTPRQNFFWETDCYFFGSMIHLHPHRDGEKKDEKKAAEYSSTAEESSVYISVKVTHPAFIIHHSNLNILSSLRPILSQSLSLLRTVILGAWMMRAVDAGTADRIFVRFSYLSQFTKNANQWRKLPRRRLALSSSLPHAIPHPYYE